MDYSKHGMVKTKEEEKRWDFLVNYLEQKKHRF